MQQWENLWPDTLGKIDVLPPVQILTKQAEYFNGMMQNILVAEVSTFNISNAGDTKSNISHHFSIKAPALGNYNATILVMDHDPLKLYPVTVVDHINRKRYNTIADENDLVDTLRSILGSKEVNQVVSSLLAQTRATMR